MSKQRSPNYPGIGLPDAVTALQAIWGKEKRTAVVPDTVAVALGYKALCGPARVKLSALKKYGLLQERAGKLCVSELGMRVLHGQAGDRLVALREAAQQVELFRLLAETHADASRDALKSYLLLEEDFSPDGAEKFIEAFLATKELAKLGGTPIMPEAQVNTEAQNINGESPVTSLNTPVPSAPLAGAGTGPFISFPLPGENSIEIRLRSKVSRGDFERIKKLIDLSEASLVHDEDDSGAQG